MLLVEIYLYCFFASAALLEIRFLLAFVDLMEVISAHFNYLSACDTVGKHLALKDIVEIELL
jgi:hypothetical protein